MARGVRFIRRGRVVEVADHRARMTLLDWLRIEERAVGTKEGCAEGDCGACTVILRRWRDGGVVTEPVNACILLVGQVDGAEVLTIEDVAQADGMLHPVQAAMLDKHGAQCGFCTPGIVMSLVALHETALRPVSRDTACDALSGNLCRCTGYRPIVEAALASLPEAPSAHPRWATPESLAALSDELQLHAGDDAAFFTAPRTEAELAALIARYPDARLLAGGTDFGLEITKALAEPQRIIWLGRIDGLDGVESTAAAVTFGATVSLTDAAPHLAALAPDMAEIMRRFGSAQVRASGTVGGNIANGSPIGDLAPCLIALRATLELGTAVGSRRMPLEDFFLAYRRQDRRPGEYVRRISVPTLGPGEQFRAYKVSKRLDEDISAVLGAFLFTIEGGRVRSARFGYGGVAGTPTRARGAERAIVGAEPARPETWAPALSLIEQELHPIDDHRASAAYRRRIARNLLEKALIECAGAAPETTRVRPSSPLHAPEARDAAR